MSTYCPSANTSKRAISSMGYHVSLSIFIQDKIIDRMYFSFAVINVEGICRIECKSLTVLILFIFCHVHPCTFNGCISKQNH